jgi:peptidoglycan-associated lipoprotein
VCEKGRKRGTLAHGKGRGSARGKIRWGYANGGNRGKDGGGELGKKEIEGEFLESSLLKDIHFGFDRYDLTPKAREILSQNAELLLKHSQVNIQIEGHCDERGTIEYNLALGDRRSTSAEQYLIALGVSSNRISTISYGEEMPADPGHNEEAWAKNRRAHFIIISR